MSVLQRNLELKARCPDLEAAHAVVAKLSAAPAGFEIQADTFFKVPHGRLKLRESENQAATLIWYQRSERRPFQTSDYHLVSVVDPARLKAALAAALGVRGVVRKRREIYLWHNLRIHLDEVESLGTFIEFEAVLVGREREAAARKRLAHLCKLFSIRARDHVGRAYADLLGL